jgi:cytochrome c peroxidase
VPTLRNADRRPSPNFVKAYGHNGYFKSLKGIVHFYNTRDAKPACANPFTREADALAQKTAGRRQRNRATSTSPSSASSA